MIQRGRIGVKRTANARFEPKAALFRAALVAQTSIISMPAQLLDDGVAGSDPIKANAIALFSETQRRFL